MYELQPEFALVDTHQKRAKRILHTPPWVFGFTNIDASFYALNRTFHTSGET